MANTYNPYSDIQAVYNAKVGWNNAETDEERKKQEAIANKARANLEAYGYSDVAEQISAEGANATKARQIMEKYAPVTSETSNVDNAGYNQNMKNATDTNNVKKGYIDSDRNYVQGQYDKIINYANSDVTQTDEYKSAFENIMPSYTLEAMQGRENELASGGASNGGNIDSFAAANALRQQSALTAKGQQIAHQAGLDAYNARVSNVASILNNLGVYNDSTYTAMDKTVNNDLNIAQTYFDNDQTAKNNLVDNLVKEASVTGYVPTEWTIKNDPVYSQFLNPDGTFKKEKEGMDIQELIDQATDPETKRKLAVVRGLKMLGNYSEYGQYWNEGDVAFMEGGQITEARRESQQNDATVRESLKTEENINSANNASQEKINDTKLQHEKDLIYLGNLGVTEDEIKAMDNAIDIINKTYKDNTKGKSVGDLITNYGNGSYAAASNVSVSSWIDPVVKMLYENGNISMEQMEYILDAIGFGDKYRERKQSGALDYIFK